jgi:ParB family transcriptional regulator, chromosome partitioning protein
MSKNRALGKGLHSLLPQRQPHPPVGSVSSPGPVTELAIDQVIPNPNQPRRDFRDQQLLELALSISADGIIQPLVVRHVNGTYELIAGERRLRAAKLAGLTKVPVVVQQIKDDRLLEVALIENIQREDLNPMELAGAFERMATELGLNHEEIGNRTGKDRATISNSIRLLQLPADVQQLIAERKLTPGHARALLKLPSEQAQREAAHLAIAEGWTVRQMEERTSEQAPPPVRKKREAAAPAAPADPNVKAAIDEMERALGTRVRIFDNGKGKGRIEIEFYSAEDLDRIYGAIAKQD